MGLHDVNADLIRDRYKRSFELLPKALEVAERAYIINNSVGNKVVAEKNGYSMNFKDEVSDDIKKLLI